MAKKGTKVDKSEKKKKDQTVSDKTFGLKNKNKSQKVQRYIETIKNSVYNKDLKKEDFEKQSKKKEEKKKSKEKNALLGSLLRSMAKMEEQKKQAMQDNENEDADQTDDKTNSLNMYLDPRGDNEERSKKMCDHFLQACEKNLYGWRWECPNGGIECTYQHKLPEGYMLKATMLALQEM